MSVDDENQDADENKDVDCLQKMRWGNETMRKFKRFLKKYYEDFVDMPLAKM